MASSRGELVAATNRTFACSSREDPSARNASSSRTRNSVTCPFMLNASSSSRKRVPPAARAMRPSRLTRASVNAPCSCPNSASSTSVSTSEPQFTATNGKCRALAGRVNGAGDQFLAGAGLAADQHRPRASGDDRNRRDRLAEDACVADERQRRDLPRPRKRRGGSAANSRFDRHGFHRVVDGSPCQNEQGGDKRGVYAD